MPLFLIQAATPTPDAAKVAPGLTTVNVVMMAVGGALLVSGGLLFWMTPGSKPGNRGTKSFAWLLISAGVAFLFTALTPLLINIAGEVGGITITAAGSVALFLILHFRGWMKVSEEMDKDERACGFAAKNETLTEEKRQLVEELDKRVAEIASLRRREDALTRVERYVYSLTANEQKSVVIVTGSILDLGGVDVWVNSENTNMYMARVTENSVSAMIRFHGAKREGQRVTDDKIADELSSTMKNKNLESVAPADVVVTRAGELEESHGVRRIFHVAAVEGTPGYGFRPVRGVEQCVRNALREVSSPGCRPLNLKSIVFPILGTGTGGGDVSEIAPKLLATAVAFLAGNPDSPVEQVNFIAYTEYQLKICLEAMKSLPVRLVSQPDAAGHA